MAFGFGFGGEARSADDADSEFGVKLYPPARGAVQTR